MTDEGALPEFAVAMRGYDRLQVDDYVVKQAVWLDEARTRMEAAEAELLKARAKAAELQERVSRLEQQDFTTPPRSPEQMGERIGRLLRVAWDSAEGLRQDAEKAAAELVARAEETLGRAEVEAERKIRLAEERAERVVAERQDEAKADAAALVEEATRESAAILTRARAEAEGVTAGTEQRRDELAAEVARLTTQRDSALAELQRVRSALEALLSPGPGARDSGAATIDLRDGAAATATGAGPG